MTLDGITPKSVFGWQTPAGAASPCTPQHDPLPQLPQGAMLFLHRELYRPAGHRLPWQSTLLAIGSQEEICALLPLHCSVVCT